MKLSFWLGSILLTVGFLAAAEETGSGPAPSPPPPAVGVYRIAAGDVLSVTVWGEDDLSGDFQVNGAGTISFPLLGDVACAGSTCRELEQTLRDRLSVFLRHPQVLVTVRKYGEMGTSVFLLGEVKKPGVYPVTASAGLMQALAAAGGPTDQADGTATIVKYRTGKFVTVPLNQPPGSPASGGKAALEPGDVVMVNRRADADRPRRYLVLGEVPDPGMFEMPMGREVRVLEAVQKAGLVAKDGLPLEMTFPRADLRRALITRGDVMVPIDLVALLRGDTSQNILLQPGDVLTVPRRPLVTVYAMGDVAKPGRQMLPEKSTLLDLLNAVGGVAASARLGDATLLRVVEGKPVSLPVNIDRLLRKGDASQNLVLQDGDVLFVPAKGERRRQLWALLPLLPYLAP